MLNLTDPTLAPLVVRYRAWVEAKNKAIYHAWEREVGITGYKRHEPSEPFFPTYQGFLDWCIREGIEVPKGEG